MKKNTAKRNQLALKGGAYSLTAAALLLAILIVVNIFVSAVPTTITRYDVSANKLYSITSGTKTLLNSLEKDVTLYWIVQSGKEDTIIENLLARYESLSPHITVVKKNPDVYPTFLDSYTDEELLNNSVIVESGARFRCVNFDEIYLYEFDYNTYSYKINSFDGESAITSAIDYVVTDALPKIYLLEGHGEGELPASFSKAIKNDNVETASLSLLTVDEIPQDAKALMIYAPRSDISEKEKTMLADYAANGGKLLVIAGPVMQTELTNLHSILSDYGVTMEPGIVVEGDRSHYAFGYPYILVPELPGHAITNPITEANYHPILPLAQGMTVGKTENGTVTKLISTSRNAFSKIAGFDLKSYEKEDGDIEGPFTLALSIETTGKGQIIWFSSSDFMQDTYNEYSSGANVSLTMNALSALIGEHEPLSIQSKSMGFSYLTINEKTAATLKVLLVGALPVAYIGIGICVILVKRRKQNASV